MLMVMSHICIIGAGISGIRCAAVLLEQGFQVTLIEARQRIGGRIAQSHELGGPIDIGAHWVHNTVDDPIVCLANDTQTPMHSWRPNTVLVDSRGKLVEHQLANRTLSAVWKTLEDAALYSQNNSAEIGVQESLYSFFLQRHPRIPDSSSLAAYERELILGMAQMWGAYVGDAVDQQSLKFFFLEECVDSEDRLIATTYEKILAKASEVVLELAHVYLGQKVTSIQGENNHVTVTTANGSKQKFSEVVVTCPLGWLQRNTHLIDPMPPRMAKAIHSISYGKLEKVFLVFGRPFWDENLVEPTSFFHWNTAVPPSKSAFYEWKMEAVSLAALPTPFKRPILLFYIFGECSSYLVSLLHSTAGEARFEAIKKFFRPYYSRLPHFTSGTCDPTAALATEWTKDEFAGFGSYSNFQVGAMEVDEDVKCIRHGIPEHHIWFAGEHTAPFDGLGTVAGA